MKDEPFTVPRRGLLALMAAGPLGAAPSLALNGTNATQVPAASIPLAPDVPTRKDDRGAGGNVVMSRAALATQAAPEGDAWFLSEGARSGMFVQREGALPAGDPLQGIYVPSTTANRYWERVWDGAVAYPEWFGAEHDDKSFDNRAAFNACLAISPIMQLGAHNYWIQGRWQIATNFRTIRGINRNADPASACTQILLNSASADVCLLGTDEAPETGQNYALFVRNVEISDITFCSPARPTPPASGFRGGPSCVRVQYATTCWLNRVTVRNGTNGFYLTGVVQTRVTDCIARRETPSSTRINDFYRGMILDATPDIAAVNGIASIYVTNFLVVGGRGMVDRSSALATENGCSDLYIDKVECVLCDYGVELYGNPRNLYSSEDCNVINCVLDQCRVGILVNGCTATGAISIMNNYVAVRSASMPSGQGIYLLNSAGSISLTNNQLLGQGGPLFGILLEQTSGVVSTGNIITDLTTPIALTNSAQSRFADKINNTQVSAAQAAIQLLGSERVVLDCTVSGTGNRFPAGIKLVGTGNSLIEARVTGLDVGAILGGASNKLVVNGAAVSLSALPTPVAFNGGAAFGIGA